MKESAWAFVLFAFVLLAIEANRYRHDPHRSHLYGIAGAACLALYGVLKTVWSNACVQMMLIGFGLYALIMAVSLNPKRKKWKM